MVPETIQSVGKIEQIDIASQDMITILAQVAEFQQTNGAVGVPRMVVTGVGERRMALPESETTAGTNVMFDATQLVQQGELVETIFVNGDEAQVNVV